MIKIASKYLVNKTSSIFNNYDSFRDNNEIMEACRRLLTNHAEEFDFSKVLPLLPDEWGITSLSDLMHRVLRTHLHRVRETKSRIKL